MARDSVDGSVIRRSPWSGAPDRCILVTFTALVRTRPPWHQPFALSWGGWSAAVTGTEAAKSRAPIRAMASGRTGPAWWRASSSTT